jgi:glutaredoxin 3
MQNITIYTMDFCPYCDRAKRLLRSRGYSYTEKKVAMDDETQWKELEAKTGMKTMPQIFIGEKCVGGCTDLEALDSAGKLAALIEA